MENMRRNILKGFDIRWLLVWLRTGACVCNALCPPKCINKNLFRSVAISANCISAFIILAISRFAIFKYMSCTISSRCGPTFSNDCILVLSLDEIVGGKFMGLRCVCFLCKCVCEWVFVFWWWLIMCLLKLIQGFLFSCSNMKILKFNQCVFWECVCFVKGRRRFKYLGWFWTFNSVEIARDIIYSGIRIFWCWW